MIAALDNIGHTQPVITTSSWTQTRIRNGRRAIIGSYPAPKSLLDQIGV